MISENLFLICMDLFRIQDIHIKPIPRCGGFFLIIPFAAAILVWHILFPDRRLLLLAGFSIAILGFGVLDDLFDFNAFVQLVFQIALAGAAVFFGIRITQIANPLGGVINLGFWGAAAAILWISGMINIINWMDGIDGLASSISFVGMLAIFFLSLLPRVGQPFSAILASILAVILLIFLFFNFPPAKIFLGTAGSIFLGFSLAVFAIISGGKIATAVIVLGIPIMDFIRVIFVRLKAGKPIFKADQNHIHHRLLKAGLSQKKIVLVIAGLSAIYGTLAVFLQSLGKFILILLLPLTFSAILLYFS